LFTLQDVEVPLALFPRVRRRRALRRLKGAIAGSGGAAALLRRAVPDLPIAVVPQLGVQVPPQPEHALHEGLAIGYVGRLVPEKGLDTLLQALAENRGGRWHLWGVGDGPDRERWGRSASERGVGEPLRRTGA